MALVVLVSALVLACGAPQSSGPMLPAPVVIFDIDTLRADHLGCYGYERPTSPRIDALAEESYRFQWAFSQAPDTGPSQSSIFTGLYPSTHGLKFNTAKLPDSVTTLAEVFLEAGYQTAAFVDGGFMTRDFGMHQGYEAYHDFSWNGLNEIGPEVLNWLDTNHEENFLLLIHTYDVHADYNPPEPFRSLFTDGMSPTPGFEPNVPQLEAVRRSRWTANPRQLNDADLEYTVARYDGGIRFADYWVGRILDHMQSLGLDRRATIVLLSDHGEEFQEHGSVQHDRLYAPVTHIPLLIRPPGGTTPKVIDSVVQGADVMPTLVEGAGLQLPPNLQGRSLVPLMRGERVPERPAFSESNAFGRRRAIVLGEYHLLGALENEELELFDYRRDPLELHDIVTEKPGVAYDLRSIAQEMQRSIERRGSSEVEVPELDEETIKGLKALGYLD